MHSELDANWEARQKHAAFFQTQIGSAQQAAIASHTTSALLITLGLAVTKFAEVTPSQSWTLLFVATFFWLILTLVLTGGFSASAVRINKAYREEHDRLFPGQQPYRLESYLLGVAQNIPWLVKSVARSKDEMPDTA